MSEITKHGTVILSIVAITLSGCSEHARVARVATEAADRQAKQNEEMARLTRDISEGSRRLTEADAEARREVLKVHRDLQVERADLSQQWNQLETERQSIARQRRTESMLVPIAQAVAGAVLVALLLGFCWTVLFGLNRRDDDSDEMSRLLVEEMVSDRPILLPAARSRPALTDRRGDPPDEQRSTGDR